MNDWIVANINNQDFTVSDFHDIADMDINNTQMLSKDRYLKSEFITKNPLFQDENGKFSKDLFDKYYDLKLKSFQEFLTSPYPTGPALDMFDTNRTKDSEIKDIGFKYGRLFSNPDRQKVGIEGINVWSEPEMSKSEIAQMNKIYDYENGEYRDYSPNDRALFNGKHDYGWGWISSFWDDPLVMAVYDEDGEHKDPITGQMVKHKKGDYRLNDEGTYYYETLGDRSPVGRDVLSQMNTITIDGTGVNKYDLFDVDDVKKSTRGVIAKNVAALAPLFMGSTVAGIYSTALIAREMMKSLPMLYGIATGLFNDDDTPKWINSVAAYGEKFSSGTSDYAKQHTFSFENIGNLISDVALQWGQQKVIAKAMNNLRGSSKYIDEAMEKAHKLYEAKKTTYGAQAASEGTNWENSILGQAAIRKYRPAAEKATVEAGKLGRNLSLAYMAIISNSDVYNDMLQAGATKAEAAAVALGSTLGMYAVDKTGLGELMFDEATEESIKMARHALKEEFKKAKDTIFKNAKKEGMSPAGGYLSIINQAAKIGKRFLNEFSDDIKYHTTNLAQKMIGEGVEEVSEEVVTDTAKSIYELAGKLGMDTSVQDVGAWNNMLERYTMNFLGGAIGGGIFYGKEVWDKGTFKVTKSDDELITLIRNGHVADLKSTLQQMKEDGKAGDTKLSADLTTSGDSKAFLTAENKEKSQNDFIADQVANKINILEGVLNNNQVNLDDDALFRQLVLSEQRYYRYQDISKLTNYYQDFADVVRQLAAAEVDYRDAANRVNGKLADGDQNPTAGMTDEAKALRQEDLLELADKVQLLRDKKNAFLSGDNSVYYMRKLNFFMDPILHSPFLPIDNNQIAKDLFGEKKQEEWDDDDWVKYYAELKKRKAESIKNLGTDAFDRFLKMEQLVLPIIQDFQLNADTYKLYFDVFSKLYDKEKYEEYVKSRYTDESQLPGESEEEYQYRNSMTPEEEADEEFGKQLAVDRINKRRLRVAELNDQLDEQWVAGIDEKLQAVGYNVDPITYRDLFGPRGILPLRTKEVINQKLHRALWEHPAELAMMRKLNPDLSNRDQLLENLEGYHKQQVQNKFLEVVNRFFDMKDTVPVIEGDEVKLDDAGNPIKTEIRGYQILDYLDANLPETFDTLQETEPGKVEQVSTYIDRTPAGLLQAMEAYELASDEEKLTNPSYAQFGKVLNSFSENTIKHLIEGLQEIQNYFGPDFGLTEPDPDTGDLLFQLLDSEDGALNSIKTIFNPEVTNYVNTTYSSLVNTIKTTLSDIENNPIYQFNQRVTAGVKNPLVEMVKGLAGKVFEGKELANIEEVLENAMTDFLNILDVNDFTLDDPQIQAMLKASDLINIMLTFLYAASKTADTVNPIGHNKAINEFVKNHLDVVENFEELPEIDADYLTVYTREALRYAQTMRNWISYAMDNQINKQKQFMKTDQAFGKSLYDKIEQLENDKAFVVDVDGEKYNLLKGAGTQIDRQLKDTDKVGVPLYQLNRIIYKNFQDALYASGLELPAFLEKTGILDQFANLDLIASLKVAKLDANITADKLTDYDTLQYIGIALTLNPHTFYNLIKARVKADDKTAPITAQEYGQMLVMAHKNQQFRDILKYAHNRAGLPYYGSFNTIILTGAAGAGKTSAEAKIAVEGEDPKKVIALGPTTRQSTGLAQSLGVTSSSTVQDFAKKILGETTYNDIMADINTPSEDGHKYFTVRLHNELGVFKNTSINVEDDKLVSVEGGKRTSIDFKEIENIPKTIVIDEATHIPTPILQILDLYMRLHKGQLILIGDTAQNGYWNGDTTIRSIEPNELFAARAPELLISLRDNNIHKQANLSAVRALINQIDEHIDLNDNSYIPMAESILSKLNFRIYAGDELNGDLITPNLSLDVVLKIKEKAGSKKSGEAPLIGFVGNKDSSAAYKNLIDAGLKENEDFVALSPQEVQGQEFEYVIVDKPLKMVKNKLMDLQQFVKDIYTMMSRGKSASIIIDNNVAGENKALSGVIGKNRYSDYTAKAPSITDKINGVSAVDKLRQLKISLLDMYDLQNPIQLDNPNASEPETTIADTKAKFYEMLRHNIDEETDTELVDKVRKEFEDEVESESDEGSDEDDDYVSQTYADIEDSLFTIPSFGNFAWLSVTGVDTKTKKGYKGREYTNEEWSIIPPESGPIRNLQALVDPEGETAFWYDSLTGGVSKMGLQRRLYDLRSAIIFNHDYRDFADAGSEVGKYITEEEYNSGRVMVEVRRADEEIVKPLHQEGDIGLKYNDKNYLVNLVYKMTGKDGREKIIDIAALNNPATLIKNLEKIKAKLLTKRETADDPEKIKLFDNILATIDAQAQLYEEEFKNWITAYEKNGEFRLDVNDAVEYNETTWFKKRGKNNVNIRLGGDLIKETGDNAIKDSRSFRTRNPHLVVSKVYTYASKQNALEDLDPSIKGRAVVFVSSDTLLKPDQLITRYISQKEEPDRFKPSVRMIVLNNYGLSFRLLMDKKFFANLIGNTEMVPLKQNLKGLHMFSDLWNFRAGLIQFNDAYNTWLLDKEYNEDYVIKIAQALEEAYYKQRGFEQGAERKATADEVKAFRDEAIAKYGITSEDWENLDKFNTENLKDVFMFRLGYTSNGKGQHVQSFDVTNSKAYNDDTHRTSKANLLVILPSKARAYYKLVDDIMSALTPNDNETQKSLNLELKDPTTGETWSKDQLISLENSNHKNTLSGLLHYSKQEGLSISKDKENPELIYTNENNWSFISGFITHVARKVKGLQESDTASNVEDETAKIYRIDEDGKRSVEPIATVSLGNWFNDDEDIDSAEVSDTLLDMFGLAFHGTTEDIHKLNDDGTVKKVGPLLTGVSFSEGFFIDPDVKRVKEGNKWVTVPIGGVKDPTYFLEMGTGENFFNVDVDVRAAGISLSLSKLLQLRNNKEEETKKDGKTSKGARIETKEEKERKFLDSLDEFTRDELLRYKREDNPDVTLDEKGIKQVAKNYNKSITSSIEEVIATVNEESLDDIWAVEADGKVLKRLSGREYINKELAKLGSEEPYTSMKVRKIKPTSKKESLVINDKYAFIRGKLTLIEDDKTTEQKISEDAKKELDESPIPRLFKPDQLKNLIKYIKSEYPNKVINFNENDVYSDDFDTFTKEEYNQDAAELIEAISQNDVLSREALEAKVDELLEKPTLAGLEDVLHSAYC